MGSGSAGSPAMWSEPCNKSESLPSSYLQGLFAQDFDCARCLSHAYVCVAEPGTY